MAENKVSLVVVVNTEDVPLEGNVNAPLQVVAQHALNQSGSRDRQLADFDLKDGNGTVLDLSRKLGDYGFAAGTKLFLSLRVGVQG